MKRTLAEYRLPWRIVGANMAQARVSRRLYQPDWWHIGGLYVTFILGALAIVGLWTFFGGD